MDRHTTRRIRTAIVAAALGASLFATALPASAQTPGAGVTPPAAVLEGQSVTPAGWSWVRANDGVGTQGWSWVRSGDGTFTPDGWSWVRSGDGTFTPDGWSWVRSGDGTFTPDGWSWVD
jgi:hypothetical protein